MEHEYVVVYLDNNKKELQFARYQSKNEMEHAVVNLKKLGHLVAETYIDYKEV